MRHQPLWALSFSKTLKSKSFIDTELSWGDLKCNLVYAKGI
jgi:hypothetical protein